MPRWRRSGSEFKARLTNDRAITGIEPGLSIPDRAITGIEPGLNRDLGVFPVPGHGKHSAIMKRQYNLYLAPALSLMKLRILSSWVALCSVSTQTVTPWSVVIV